MYAALSSSARRDSCPAGDADRSRWPVSPARARSSAALAVADDAGDPDDLAAPRGERDVGEAAAARGPSTSQQRRIVVGRTRFGGKVDASVRPMISASSSASVMSVTDAGAAQRAVAQDRDAVRDLAHLAEPVRDVDDRRSVRREAAGRRGEQQVDGLL